MNHYKESNVLIIDMDQVDIEKYPEHRELIVSEVIKAYQRLKDQDTSLEADVLTPKPI